jgi:Flp pilus assembly protein TadD
MDVEQQVLTLVVLNVLLVTAFVAFYDITNSFILWKTRGEVALKQGNQPLARDAYAKAAELSPDTECLNRLAALVLALDGDRERARTLWQRSLELDPKQPRVEEALAALAAEAPRP